MKLWWLWGSATTGMAFVALAHTGQEHFSGYKQGFPTHLGNSDDTLDHARGGSMGNLFLGWAIWAAPLSFAGLVAVGVGLGIAGVAVPCAKTDILVSVMFLGVLLVLGANFPLGAAVF